MKVQRKVVIRINKAYRTISREANLVVAGIPPIDLKIAERIGRWQDKMQEIDVCTSQRQRRQNLIQEWQERWDNTEKGRVTYEYFPALDVRMKNKLFGMNHYTTQYLSGHGNFKYKLFGFRLVEDGNCITCNVPEDVNHVLFVCLKYLDLRTELMFKLFSQGLFYEKSNFTRNQDTFNDFIRMVSRIGKRKEMEDNE